MSVLPAIYRFDKFENESDSVTALPIVDQACCYMLTLAIEFNIISSNIA